MIHPRLARRGPPDSTIARSPGPRGPPGNHRPRVGIHRPGYTRASVATQATPNSHARLSRAAGPVWWWSRAAHRVARVRRGLFWLALAVAATACLGLGWSLLLVRGAPPWWRTIPPDTEPTARLAQQVENGVVSTLHQVRPTDEAYVPPAEGHWRSTVWSVGLRASDANAWLNTRLPKWFANSSREARWPGDLEGVQVEFDDGRIHVGAQVSLGDRRRIISATLVPNVQPDGSLWMRATTVRLGRLPIPPSWVLGGGEQVPAVKYVPEEFRELPETRQMFRAFIGRRPLLDHAVLPLEDGRQVRLLQLVPRDGRLRFTCRTEVDPQRDPASGIDAAVRALEDVADRAAAGS